MTQLARLSALGAMARGLLPPSVAVGVGLACAPGLLRPEERAGVARATPDRQREFAGGRAAARAALDQLGIADAIIPMGDDRAPVWPKGTAGSITHAEGLCLAAASLAPGIIGLGIDLEPDTPLPDDLRSEVVVPGDYEVDDKLLFSIKETVFKALYPQVGFIFGFDAVRVTLHGHQFIATTAATLGRVPTGTRMIGQFGRAEGFILTALAF